MARPKTKKAEPKKEEPKQQIKKSSSRRFPIRFHLPFPRLSAQASYLFLGVTIPGLMIWVANWMIFSLYEKVAFIKDFLTVQAETISSVLPDYSTPAVYEQVLFGLDTNQGVVFVIVGLLVFVAAITLAMWMARRFKASSIKLGELNLQSVGTWAVLSLTTIVLVMASLQQLFVNSFPTELKQIFWP